MPLKMQKLLFVVLMLANTCQSHKSMETSRVTAIQNGIISFADGSTKAIPHHDDPAYSIFYCVRHAEKAKDGTNDPDLTPEGYARAERLGIIMDNAQLDKVCATNFKRTIHTAEAVKLRAGDPPIEIFPPEAQDDWLAEALAAGGGKRYFVVGHQNTIPQLLNRLSGGTTFKNIPDDEFGRFYIVVTQGIGKAEVMELRY